VSRFRFREGRILARFSTDEAALLAGLARQIDTIVATSDTDADGDAVLERLFPNAYPDNDEYAAEFRRFTREELGDEKAANARMIVAALDVAPVSHKVRVELDPAGAQAWLRGLNDIRLALAVRLGIGVEHHLRIDDFAFTYAAYSWLGAVQDSLVRAVDR
jgi:Domain of unknown function (DUF2017)